MDDERVMRRLTARVEWESRTIQEGLSDGMMPLAALAALLASKPKPARAQFQAVAESACQLGMPMGQLFWAPVVPGHQRYALEATQQAELPGYRINELDASRQAVVAEDRPEYVPVLYEALNTGYPSNLGFDIASDPARRRALSDAREAGTPVGLQPRLSQQRFGAAPIYVVYWPLYEGPGVPATIADRRLRLTGYVVSVMRVSDMLGFTMRNLGSKADRISFAVKDSGEAATPFASYIPGKGLIVGDAVDVPQEPGAVVLHHTFDTLHHDWLLEFRIPAKEAASMRGSSPLMAAGLMLLLTAGLAYAAFERERRSARDLAHRQVLEAASVHQIRTNQALLAANALLVTQEQAAVGLALARTRLLAIASHDLRQPLTALTLFVSALRSRVSDPVGGELLGNIAELARSMQRMFTNLLDLSRLDSGALKGHIRPHPMEEVVGRLTAEFAREAKQKGLLLRRVGRFPPVETDPALLESVLRNLIGNAVKFTDRGRILIGGRISGAVAAIQVWDTGPGIPASETERMFRQFERLHTETAKPGFGLGLSIVKQLCREIGATCTVRSRLGRGSCFTVELPLAERPNSGSITAAGLRASPRC